MKDRLCVECGKKIHRQKYCLFCLFCGCGTHFSCIKNFTVQELNEVRKCGNMVFECTICVNSHINGGMINGKNTKKSDLTNLLDSKEAQVTVEKKNDECLLLDGGNEYLVIQECESIINKCKIYSTIFETTVVGNFKQSY